MTWFKVDDSFHSHAKALKAGNPALGLWVRCGSYCAQHLTDGFIPRQVVLMYGNRALAAKLVEAGLWEVAQDGWRMHDYGLYNPSAERVRSDRDAATERQRQAREVAMSRRDRRVTHGEVTPMSQRSSSVSHGPPDPTRTQPNPKPPGEDLGGDRPETNAHARNGAPPKVLTSENRPPDRCSLHTGPDTDPGPCGGCAKARQHAERWDDQRKRAHVIAVRSCTWCDNDGWRTDPRNKHRGPLTPGIRCDHTTWSAEQIQQHAS